MFHSAPICFSAYEYRLLEPLPQLSEILQQNLQVRDDESIDDDVDAVSIEDVPFFDSFELFVARVTLAWLIACLVLVVG